MIIRPYHHYRVLGPYACGEKLAGTSTLVDWLTRNSRVGGGQCGVADASARILSRSARSW